MTMENDLVERLRATADLGNNIYNPWPQVRLNEAADRIQALEAELARKTEALRPWGVIADAVLSEAPADATKAKLWNGVDNSPLFISLDACRAARSALEENTALKEPAK